jgi:molybdopterin-guanine dinucleotide biosynthesis protein B
LIVQFVGFQNSGKTTAMEWTIRKLNERGISVVALKHHGHGGPPNTIVKDSTKYKNAGAIASVVVGDGELHLEIGKQNWSIEKIQTLVSCLDYDLLLIEGYKHECFPKIVFIRSEEDREKLISLSNIHTIIPFCKKLDEKEDYINEIVHWIEGELKCSK